MSWSDPQFSAVIFNRNRDPIAVDLIQQKGSTEKASVRVMPIVFSEKSGSIDPLTGIEHGEDRGGFRVHKHSNRSISREHQAAMQQPGLSLLAIVNGCVLGGLSWVLIVLAVREWPW